MFFNKQKFVENLAFSMSEEALFPRKLASHFLFLSFFIPFSFGSGSKSGSRTGSAGPGTVMHCGSDSAKVKSYGSCCSSSGSTRLFKIDCLPKDLQDTELSVLRGHRDRIRSLLLQFLHTAKIITGPQSDQP
jgi:hypothetical protein